MINNVFIMNATIDKVVKAHTGYITVAGYINRKYIRVIGFDNILKPLTFLERFKTIKTTRANFKTHSEYLIKIYEAYVLKMTYESLSK